MLAVIIIGVGDQTMAGKKNDDDAELGIAGKGWTDTEAPYDTLKP